MRYLGEFLSPARLKMSLASLLRGEPQPPGAGHDDHNFRVLVTNGAFLGLSDGVIGNFISVFLARAGASPALLGWLTAGPSLVGILTYIPGGFYAERFTDMVGLAVRASFLVRSVYLVVAVLPFFLSLDAAAVATVVVWSLSMIPSAVHVPAWSAVMQRAVSPRRRPLLNGARWSMVSIVSAVAIVVVGYILDRTPFPEGYQAIFLFSFVIALVQIYFFGKVRIPPFAVLPKTDRSEQSMGQRWRAQFGPFLESRLFMRYMVSGLAYRVAANMPAALFSIFWVSELQATDTWIGIRGTAGYVALVVGYRAWGRVAVRIGHRTVLLICCAGLGLYPIMTALSPSVEWLIPAALVWGITASGMDIGIFDMLLTISPEGRQPSFAAVNSMVASICGFVGPLAGAAMVGFMDIRLALIVTGVLTVASALFFLMLPNRQQEEELHASAGH